MLSCLVALRIHDPSCRLTLITRWLRLVELPGAWGSLEALEHLGCELRGKVGGSISAVRVDVLVGKGCQTLRLHPTFRHQPFHEIDVPLTPHALWLPGCEANHKTLVVTRPSNSIDPSVAERFGDGFFPGDGWLACGLLVVPHPEMVRRCVVLVEPGPKFGRFGEEQRVFFRHMSSLGGWSSTQHTFVVGRAWSRAAVRRHSAGYVQGCCEV